MNIDYLIGIICNIVGIEHELSEDASDELYREAEELSALASKVIYRLEDEM